MKITWFSKMFFNFVCRFAAPKTPLSLRCPIWPQLQTKFDHDFPLKTLIFQWKFTHMRLQDLPYGTAERQGGRELQNKFDHDYPSKTLIFQWKWADLRLQICHMGQRRDRGCLNCKRNSIKISLLKHLYLNENKHFTRRKSNAFRWWKTSKNHAISGQSMENIVYLHFWTFTRARFF